MEKKRRKIKKKRWKIENRRRKTYKMRRGPFFFFFHFSKLLQFVLGVTKWEFSTVGKLFLIGKKIRKNDFTTSEKYSCYAPGGRGKCTLLERRLRSGLSLFLCTFLPSVADKVMPLIFQFPTDWQRLVHYYNPVSLFHQSCHYIEQY